MLVRIKLNKGILRRKKIMTIINFIRNTISTFCQGPKDHPQHLVMICYFGADSLTNIFAAMHFVGLEMVRDAFLSRHVYG